jgi:hypothetical protein
MDKNKVINICNILLKQQGKELLTSHAQYETEWLALEPFQTTIRTKTAISLDILITFFKD